jgi:hypothetical protein
VVNDTASGVSMPQALKVFEQAGRSDLGAGFNNSMRRQVDALVREAADLTAAQDYRGACAAMQKAARMAPGDARVQGGSVASCLQCMDQLGWDAALGDQARLALDSLRLLEPDGEHGAQLAVQYHAVQRKYGISA